MSEWSGYAVWSITTALTEDTLDEDGNVTELGTKSLAKNAVLLLGTQSGLPHIVTHIRPSLDGQKILIDITLEEKITKAEAVEKLAEFLPYTEQQISNNSTLQVFSGANREARRLAAVQYLIDNSEDWEEVI